MPTATQEIIKKLKLGGIEPLQLTIQEARKILGRTHVISPPGANLKLAKGEKVGWETAGLSLAPHTSAGGPTVCPHSTPQCRAFCVSGSGNAIVFQEMIDTARVELTKLLLAHPAAFIRAMIEDVVVYGRRAAARGNKFTVRLNVFSDLEWELIAPEIFEVMQAEGVAAL